MKTKSIKKMCIYIKYVLSRVLSSTNFDRRQTNRSRLNYCYFILFTKTKNQSRLELSLFLRETGNVHQKLNLFFFLFKDSRNKINENIFLPRCCISVETFKYFQKCIQKHLSPYIIRFGFRQFTICQPRRTVD